jgi:aminoglycoside phosphotransferase (APT) family kinase protein
MRKLWACGFARDAQDHISIPEPLHFSSSLCMLFQEEVGGVPVKNILRQSPQPEHLRQVARTIAKLHQSPLVPGKPFTVKDHLTRCHPRHEFLSLASPKLAPMVEALIRGAHEVERSFGNYKMTALHGDFHLGQIHLENENVWLIDFDALSYGDPASDLGNLLVFLKGKIKRQPEMRELIEVFLQEYFSIIEPAVAHRIPLYEGLTHLRRACKCLRLQEEGWERRVKRMVEMGMACIEEMKQSVITPESEFFKAGYDDEVAELELQEAE